MTTQVDEFVARLRDAMPGVPIEIDAPANPKGEWWIDIFLHGGPAMEVTWRHDKGFGVCHARPAVFGEGPDEVYEDMNVALRRVLQLARAEIKKRELAEAFRSA